MKVAGALNNLALLHLTKGEYAQAEPLLNRALAIQEKRFGPKHREVAGTLHNLATLYFVKGDVTVQLGFK